MTLINLMGALDTPTRGEVYLNESSLKGLRDKYLSAIRREKLGFIFQQYRLLEEFNLLDNICVPCYLGGRKPQLDYVEELLKYFGLWERRNAFPGELSGGQQQRVAAARAMAHKPALILGDEPTGNLDSQTGKELIDLLENAVKRYGQTLVVVTHDMEIAKRAKRIIEIADGEIISDSSS